MIKISRNSSQPVVKPLRIQPPTPISTLVRKKISFAPFLSDRVPQTGPSRATIMVTMDTPRAQIPVAASELICPAPSPTARVLNQMGIREQASMVKAEFPTS